MRKTFLFTGLALLVFFAGFATPVLGCHFCRVDIAADCEGFVISGEVRCNWFYHPDFTINYNIEIVAGLEILPVTGSVTFPVENVEPNLCVPFEIRRSWDASFCGDVVISGVLEAVSKADSDTAGLEPIDLFCPCACTRTPGYWKNRPEAWPVEELLIGGVLYTKAALLEKLNMPVRGDISIKLFHHLVAAMLNVFSEPANNTPSVQLIIAAADGYFAAPTDCDKNCVVALKDALDEFNNSGENLCDNGLYLRGR